MRPELEHISSWDFTREIQPGVYVHTDYDFERPSVKLKTQKAGSRTFAPSPYEVYDYPGHYLQKADGEQYAAVRIDEVSAASSRPRRRSPTPRASASDRCSRSTSALARIRTANT